MSDHAGRAKVTYRSPAQVEAERPARKRRHRAPDDDEYVDESEIAAGSRKRKRVGSGSSDTAARSPLLTVCEPLFERICLYSHAIQNGVKLSTPLVRREIEEIFDRIRKAANSNPELAGVYNERIEQSLLFFVDNFFADCGQLPIANEWGQNRLAFALNPPNYVGDEQFFTNLNDTLKENREGTKHQLAVFFACLGLGMTGIYANQPQVLRRKQQEIAQRIRGLLESSAKRRICPDAYENIHTENLIEPPIKPPLLIAIGLGGMLLVLVVVYFVAYYNSTSQLKQHLKAVQNPPQSVNAPSARTR